MKKTIAKIVIAFILFCISLLIHFEYEWINKMIYMISYLIVGIEVVKAAFENILKGEVFDENFLMSVATLGAFIIGEFPEAVAVMLFYQVGELFQTYAVDKSRRQVTSLMDIRPDFANIKHGNEVIKVEPNEVEIGDSIIVKPGEKIPLDGIVIEGNSMIDTSALTGEAVPRQVEENTEVLSGCINQNGVLTIKVTKKFGESTVSKILDLVENASSRKSRSENFITKFAKIYTPAVVIIALLLAIVPPFILQMGTFIDWLYRALTFLVVSCPCALVISIPLGFFGGIGGASKAGILVKGSNYLEALAKTEIVIFDKTGTLTKGVFEVQKVVSRNISEDELLKIVAHVEEHSNHPIAMSVKKAYGKDVDMKLIEDVQEIAGQGIEATVEGKKVLVGNSKLMQERRLKYTETNEIGTILYIAIDSEFAGYIVIADEIKEDSFTAIKRLKQKGIKKIVMLTGDRKEVGEAISKKLGIDRAYTELLPDGKVEKIEEFLKQTSKEGKVVFVGDGMNDAPVLALADIGVAMGGIGTDSAIEAADIVIMTDEPSKLVNSIEISKKTMRIVKQNIIFSIVIKLGVLCLSAIGMSTMWEAVFADVGVSVIAILNSLRALKVRR